jgi:DNA-binding CsgD family transcriptional regulator
MGALDHNPFGQSDASGANAPDWLDPALEKIWSVLQRSPLTGVGVFTLDGEVLFVNDRAVQMWHGPDAKASAYIGRNARDHMPEQWTNERLAILQRVRETNKPVMLRSIWRGNQHFSWIYPILHEGSEPDIFLVIARRAETMDDAEELMRGDYEWVDSNVANFGKLDVLTDREMEVLALLAQGLSAKEIAKVLYRSEHTIISHRKAIGQKLGLDDRLKLALLARRAGLTVKDADRVRVDAPPALE